MEKSNTQENTSGRGKQFVAPPEIRRWNWGAFLLNWIWGIGNGTYIALLMFVPLVNIVMLFVLGAKGSEWAWQNRYWRDVEHFKSTQRKWAWAGLIFVVVFLPTCIAVPMTAMKRSDAFSMSLSEIQRNEQLIEELGEPIEAGLFVTGNIQISGPDGEAELQYSVEGSRAEGQAFVYARKHAGLWELKELVVETPGKRIGVIAPQKESSE
jgi:hypothetical protein